MDRDEWENEAINHYYMFWESHMQHSRVKANCADFKLYLYLGGKTTGSLQYGANHSLCSNTHKQRFVAGNT